jgi:hypothetical protein
MNTTAIFLFLGAAVLVSCGDDSGKSKETAVSIQTTNQNRDDYQLNTCPEVGDCQFACEDYACVEQCIHASDPVALSLFNDFYDCAVEKCSGAEEGCVGVSCPAQQDACNGIAPTQPNPKPGLPTDRHYNCSELVQCAGDCPDDTCTDACIAFSTESAIQTLSDLLACNNDCTDAGGTDCLDTVCKSETDACLNDISGP